MSRLLPSIVPSEEIDLADAERKQLGEHKPLPYTIKQILGWRAEYHQGLGYHTDEVLPLVVRRELYRGLDENSYLHHDFWALYFVRRGYGTHIVNGHPWSMVRGNVYLLAPGAVHHYRGAADVVLDAVYFGETLFSPEEQAALGELSGAAPLVVSLATREANTQEVSTPRPGHFLHLSPQRQIEVEETISQIRHELTQHEYALHLSAKSRLWCLMVQLALWRGETPHLTRGGESRELADVLHFCETHFAHALTIEQLAAMTHFSRNHFTRLFTREIGLPPATYLRHLRLQHAQKLLRETLHSTNDIAQLCGFSDATAFSRAFQKNFELSPLAYRKANKRAPKYRADPKSAARSRPTRRS